MERFSLRAHYQPKRGTLWELQLVPDKPNGGTSGSERVLGSVSTNVSINWLREIVRPHFQALTPPRDADKFGARSEPVLLGNDAGMRLALAFSAARYLVKPRQRRQFREGLAEMPPEVVLYWFTLCFYGQRTAAARAALRTLLAYDEPAPPRRRPAKKPSRTFFDPETPSFLELFDTDEANADDTQ